MAISIDNVYQQVLAVMSKERRGELTPPHFNILAAKAQNDIFEKTMYDYQTALREQSDSLPMLKEKFHDLRASGLVATNGTLPTSPHFLESISRGATETSRTVRFTFGSGANVNSDPTDNTNATQLRLRGRYQHDTDSLTWILYIYIADDVPTTVHDKGRAIGVNSFDSAVDVATAIADGINDFSPFHSARTNGDEVIISYDEVISTAVNGDANDFTEALFHHAGAASTPITIQTTKSSGGIVYEEVDEEYFNYVVGTPKIKPTADRPIFCRKAYYQSVIKVSPSFTEDTKPTAIYISKPSDPKWVGEPDGVYFKKAGGFTNFSLHPSEESSLVNKILELVGVTLDEPGLSNAAIQNEAAVENDKNN